ncbi:hypothetical protein DXN04_14525 [Chitinophaga silvisoli]|uniref:Uncharacterized protein n=1 Tax=Chitinophaga silvisoli TaxID=2291814 RepID=A0A3E1P3B5_9BACT|nr:hypothetical protein DXN04_14525 [Chitinophaga silvisoli]
MNGRKNVAGIFDPLRITFLFQIVIIACKGSKQQSIYHYVNQFIEKEIIIFFSLFLGGIDIVL